MREVPETEQWLERHHSGCAGLLHPLLWEYGLEPDQWDPQIKSETPETRCY